MSANKLEDKVYIQTKLDDILKNMMTKMFVSNPSDPVSETHVVKMANEAILFRFAD